MCNCYNLLLVLCRQCWVKMVENDYPKARTNRVFVVNVVHGSPRDIFPCPPRRMTPLLPRTRGDSVDLFLKSDKRAVSRKNLGSRWGNSRSAHIRIRIYAYESSTTVPTSILTLWICVRFYSHWLDVTMSNFLIAAHIQMKNKKTKITHFFSRRFRRGWLLLYFLSRFSLWRCPRQRRLHERYS